jgi:hypothetical protein
MSNKPTPTKPKPTPPPRPQPTPPPRPQPFHAPPERREAPLPGVERPKK